ncbi:MAG: hypothetical protein RIC35_13295 [Marinoscillum sp.]
MKHHTELSDSNFLLLFENGDLEPALFNHEAHLRLAYLRIKEVGLQEAIIKVTSQIQNYVTKLGAQSKYNHTLTIAAIKAVNHFIVRSGDASFTELLEQFPKLQNDFKGLMETHYSTDILQSTKAKVSYMKPDLLPFS